MASFENHTTVLGSYMRRARVRVLMTDPRWARQGCSVAIMAYMACGMNPGRFTFSLQRMVDDCLRVCEKALSAWRPSGPVDTFPFCYSCDEGL